MTDADDVTNSHDDLRADADGRQTPRRRFAETTLSGVGVDLDALREVHEHGWTRG